MCFFNTYAEESEIIAWSPITGIGGTFGIANPGYCEIQILQFAAVIEPPKIGIRTSLYEGLVLQGFRNGGKEAVQAWSYLPVYLCFFPRIDLKKTTRKGWWVARPMIYSFAGGSAWGKGNIPHLEKESCRARYFHTGLGILWEFWDGRRGGTPISCGVQSGWASITTEERYFHAERNLWIEPTSTSSAYIAFTFSMSWLMPLSKGYPSMMSGEQEIEETQPKPQEQKEKEAIKSFSDPNRIRGFGDGNVGWCIFRKFGLQDKDGTPFHFPDSSGLNLAGGIAIEKSRLSIGLNSELSFAGKSPAEDTGDVNTNFLNSWIFGRYELWHSKFLSVSPEIGGTYMWMEGRKFLQQEDSENSVYSAKRCGAGALVGLGIRVEKRDDTFNKFLWRPFIDAKFNIFSPLQTVYSGLVKTGFSFQGTKLGSEITRRHEWYVSYKHIYSRYVKTSVIGFGTMAYFR